MLMLDRRVLGLGVGVLLGALALLAPWGGLDIAGALGEGLEPAVEQEARALEQTRRELVLRNRRKDRVARTLLAGRLSLLEAAAYYRALDLGPPALDWQRFRSWWPGGSDAERHCHEVIEWAYPRACLEGDVHGRALRDRLSAELAEHLRRGPLRLPEPATPLEALDDDAF